MVPRFRAPMVVLAALALGWSDPIAGEEVHRPLRGNDWPDGVLALTWDDGPDTATLSLAKFLHDSGVRGTFFAVDAWVPGLSEEPGVMPSGHSATAPPAAAEVAALGHRVGSHTQNHVLLGHATRALAHEQVGAGPFLGTDLHLFRAPAGWWTPESVAAFADRSDLVGPVHWDIDAKDWECSLYCRSDNAAAECEPGPVGPRVRPAVIADRYFAQIRSQQHGIVLFHDRVGNVGSEYALDVAKSLIPRLVAAHYVFVAPVLNFGRLVARPASAAGTQRADINGDGVLDRCRSTARGVECELGASDGSFKAPSIWWPTPLAAFELVDINADDRADLCLPDRCALAP